MPQRHWEERGYAPTRRADTDDESRMGQMVRASWFQFVTPGLITLAVIVGGWYLNGINTTLEDLKKGLAEMHEDGRLLDARIKSLEDSRAARNSEMAAVHSDVTDLKLQVGLLAAGVHRKDLK